MHCFALHLFGAFADGFCSHIAKARCLETVANRDSRKRRPVELAVEGLGTGVRVSRQPQHLVKPQLQAMQRESSDSEATPSGVSFSIHNCAVGDQQCCVYKRAGDASPLFPHENPTTNLPSCKE